MNEDFSFEQFWNDVYWYIRANTYILTYRDMPIESRTKYVSKLTIDICKEYSPRKNYDISKAEIREFVGIVLADWEAESSD